MSHSSRDERRDRERRDKERDREHERSRRDGRDREYERDRERGRDREYDRRSGRDREYERRDCRDDRDEYSRRDRRDYKEDRRDKDDKDRESKSERHTKEEPQEDMDLDIDLSSIMASIAQDKEKMEKKKEELSQKIPAKPELSSEVDEAIKRARMKMELKKKSRPEMMMLDQKGLSNDQFIAESLRIKDSLINRRLGRQQLEVETAPVAQKDNKFFDSRLGAPKTERDRRSFHFVTPGTFIKQGQSLRAQQWASQKNFDEQHPINKRIFRVLNNEPVPTVEWWDKPFFPAECQEYQLDKIIESEITLYVEHPVPEKAPLDPGDVKLPSFLTEKEKKKLRRMRREEMQKEKQIKIMMGLEQAPNAKATLTNMIRVYGTKAFEDPTKIDQMVRQQMQERLSKHIQQNEERKLTPEQRRQKKLDKLRKNDTGCIQAVVYKVKDISSPLHRKNIDHSTRDGELTGCLLICQEGDCNLVVAEGGPKAIKKFKRLMSFRLKWTENNPDNLCDMIWEGVLPRRMFRRFRFHELATQKECREVLEKRNAVQYWDTAVNFSAKLID